MALPFLRKFTTAGPEGDGRQAYVNADGAFIGCGTPLLERDAYGRWTPRDTAVLEGLLTKGYGVPVALGGRAGRLRSIAEALNKGDLALAGISLVYLELPPLPSDAHAQAMAEADDLLSKYNRDQPRAPKGDPDGGQWVGGGDAGGGHASGAHEGGAHAGIILAVDREDPTHAKKRRFIEAHLADAQKAAAELHVPVENILGITALESGWGTGDFVQGGKNNYFGAEWPAPFSGKPVSAAGNPKRLMATFSSYKQSLDSFIQKNKSHLFGVSDPSSFAKIAQEIGKFGINTETGEPEPHYTNSVVATIRSVRRMLGEKIA